MSSTAKLTKSGKTTFKRQRRVLRDGIEGISRPALQRIMRRAGIKRISESTYGELRNVMTHYMKSIIRDMVIFVEHNERKTVQIKDLKASLEMNNIQLAADLNPSSKKNNALQSCQSVGKSGPSKRSKEPASAPESVPSSRTKPYRFRPGTGAIRAIKYQQKNSDCLSFPKANFDRYTRELTRESHQGDDDLRFSDGVLDLFQLVVEDYLVDLCSDAYNLTLFAERDTIQPKDIHLARKLRKEEDIENKERLT